MHTLDQAASQIANAEPRVVAGELFVVACVYREYTPTYEVSYIDETGEIIDLTGAGEYAYDDKPLASELMCLLAEHRCSQCWRVFTEELDGAPCGECKSVNAEIGAEIDRVAEHLGEWDDAPTWRSYPDAAYCTACGADCPEECTCALAG